MDLAQMREDLDILLPEVRSLTKSHIIVTPLVTPQWSRYYLYTYPNKLISSQSMRRSSQIVGANRGRIGDL